MITLSLCSRTCSSRPHESPPALSQPHLDVLMPYPAVLLSAIESRAVVRMRRWKTGEALANGWTEVTLGCKMQDASNLWFEKGKRGPYDGLPRDWLSSLVMPLTSCKGEGRRLRFLLIRTLATCYLPTSTLPESQGRCIPREQVVMSPKAVPVSPKEGIYPPKHIVPTYKKDHALPIVVED
ncbi:hypothetical protein DXG01_010997 [Tephrocybe rancida]|nr:hypothetical protein DXG01_010997 [Tephrocybe rancida]